MDQPRIHRRLVELGLGIELSHAVVGAARGEVQDRVRVHGRHRALACDALVLVTSRLPNDGLGEELARAARRMEEAGVASVRIVG